MDTKSHAQGTITSFALDGYVPTWLEAFLIDRKAQNLTAGTIEYYRKKLTGFADFCEGQAVTQLGQVDANLVRRFLFWLEERGSNPGGVHAYYRAVKAFLRWWELETEPENWRNPFDRVKSPKVDLEPLVPADTDVVNSLLKTCQDDYTGKRDRAIFLGLLDTGCRANEFLSIDVDDVDLVTGAVVIRKSKRRQPRTVYLGRRARQAVRNWLKVRGLETGPLWVGVRGGRLKYDGLRAMVARRAKLAGVEPPALHSFRRAFALTMLRSDVDVFTIQKLMGHADLQVLRRYLAQTDADLLEAHRRASPADQL